jgi:hypothetical protein
MSSLPVYRSREWSRDLRHIHVVIASLRRHGKDTAACGAITSG